MMFRIVGDVDHQKSTVFAGTSMHTPHIFGLTREWMSSAQNSIQTRCVRLFGIKSEKRVVEEKKGKSSVLVLVLNKVLKMTRAYKKAWERESDLKDWIELGPTRDVASCKLCKTTIRAHIGDLKRHIISLKHERSVNAKTMQKSVMVKQPQPTTVTPIMIKKRKELRLALYCAVHASFRAVDPLVDLLNNEYKDQVSNQANCLA